MIRNILQSVKRDERTDENEKSRKCIRNADALTFSRLGKIKKVKSVLDNHTSG